MLFILGCLLQRAHDRITKTREVRTAELRFMLAEIDRQANAWEGYFATAPLLAA